MQYVSAHWAGRLILPIVWLAVIILFGVLEPSTFLTLSNFASMFASQASLLVIALGLIIPLTAGDYDLSIASVAGFSAMIVAVLNVNHHWPIVPAIIVAMLACLAVGVLNAVVVVALGVESIVATLGMGTLLGGIVLLISNSTAISGIANSLSNAVVSHSFLGIPLEFYYGLALCALLGYYLAFVPSGRRLLYVGRSREVARLSGIRVGRCRAGALVASALFGGIAGLLIAGTTGSADPSSFTALLLPGFAAAFLGATTIVPGKFTPAGVLVAVYFLVTGITGLELLGAQTYVQDVFYGAALIISVALAELSAGRRPSLRLLWR
ncbi:MAG TPA: ABC transporter permease [Streptosporangiaceae bacterium]|nr:ABC transporter permease [Streptosporangiaceae bacterium]